MGPCKQDLPTEIDINEYIKELEDSAFHRTIRCTREQLKKMSTDTTYMELQSYTKHTDIYYDVAGPEGSSPNTANRNTSSNKSSYCTKLWSQQLLSTLCS